MTSFYIHVIHANADLLVALTVIPGIEVLLFFCRNTMCPLVYFTGRLSLINSFSYYFLIYAHDSYS